MSKVNLKEINEELYRKALSSSWAVDLDTSKTFPPQIVNWIENKRGELGVPFTYLAYPFLTSIAYCLGVSEVEVTKTYKEPVILYSLVSGRSGTNKSSCITFFRNIVSNLPNLEPLGEESSVMNQQHMFDSGTMEGLMKTLEENYGTVLCAVDEFNTFIDSIDKNTNGSAERARYLSLWSGSSWSKNTKNGGLVEIIEPRFQFIGFNQNYYLLNLVVNTQHFDGFLPRFLVATPKEEYITLSQKIMASNNTNQMDIQKLFDRIFNNFFVNGFKFPLNDEAMVLFTKYHDEDVLEFRKNDLFEDIKSMIMSKSIGNVLRVAAIQCAIRTIIEHDDNLQTMEDVVINKDDIMRAIVLVKYSTRCLFTLIDSTKEPTKKGKKRYLEMPSATAIDEEFLLLHKTKIQKLFKYDAESIPLSVITRNHMCPQIGGKNDSNDVKRFLEGLEKHGLGKVIQKEEKRFFKKQERENISEKVSNLMNQLDII